MPFGVNFKKHLEGVVQQCAVELVLIGKQWLDITDENGQRRLDNPRDFVRIEIEVGVGAPYSSYSFVGVGRELRAYLISHLLPDQRGYFDELHPDELIDWIDPETAEVRRVDALTQALQKAARDAQFINEHITLVDAVFRTFLANGNKPLSPNELGERLERPPMTILRTLAVREVYKGIRPLTD